MAIMSYIYILKFIQGEWLVLTWILGFFIGWLLTGMVLVYFWYRLSSKDDL